MARFHVGHAALCPTFPPCGIRLLKMHTLYVWRFILPPIGRIPSFCYATRERAIGPFGNATHIAVFDGVVMNVIHMPSPIVFVTNGVLPKAALPNGLFSFRLPGDGLDRLRAYASHAEKSFDTVPSAGVVVVILREGPKGVQVIGKDDDGFKVEWVFLLFSFEGMA